MFQINNYFYSNKQLNNYFNLLTTLEPMLLENFHNFSWFLSLDKLTSILFETMVSQARMVLLPMLNSNYSIYQLFIKAACHT